MEQIYKTPLETSLEAALENIGISLSNREYFTEASEDEWYEDRVPYPFFKRFSSVVGERFRVEFEVVPTDYSWKQYPRVDPSEAEIWVNNKLRKNDFSYQNIYILESDHEGDMNLGEAIDILVFPDGTIDLAPSGVDTPMINHFESLANSKPETSALVAKIIDFLK